MPRKKIRKIDADDQVIEMLFDFSREENDSNDVLHSHADQKDYTILNRDAIEQRQDDDINNVANSLSISRAAAIILLCHYNWSVSKSCEKWFDDEEKIRKSLGLLEEPVPLPSGNELRCRICFENYPRDEMSAPACGHSFCSMCWIACIKTIISNDWGCLKLRCPLQSCGVAVGEDMINALATPEDKEKYRRYLRRSFIEDSRKRKWCPAPECNNAVEFIAGSGSNDVLCDCSCSFCWKCMEEAHWPVGCDIVSRILVEEKPCPTCRRPIKWNQGSIAVRCSAPCKYQFCWSCLRSWAFHGEGLFVFRACNQYRPAKEISEYGVTNECRGMAKDSVERYSHYYYRWATNETSRKRALANLQQMGTVHREKFIIDAWLQIVECRKVLKWTYVYGYYLADDNLQQIFEDVQGRAEYNLEELHQYAELELKKYLEGHGPSMGLNMLRDKLIRRTCVTGKLFKDLIYAIEHDLEGFISCMASHPAVHPASKRAWKER
ncbi:putative E3 ubiquitin-protein ligase ARI8 isoform X2 [Apium graveolens]|uniref:putative E3 ubiquitin-protein ligase ARI8 isoform X2 n=1 Tax=Apium graveolens TaxID=4045 RepID=UPI003D7903B6